MPDLVTHGAVLRVTRIALQELDRAADGRERHIINRKIPADPQQAGGIEAIEERVVEGVPAVDEDEVELTLLLFSQSRQGKLRLGLEQLKGVDAGFLQMLEPDSIPVPVLVRVDDRVRRANPSARGRADEQRGQAVGASNLERADDSGVRSEEHTS